MRIKLRETREGVVHKVTSCGYTFYLNVNFYAGTAKPGEVFITIAKRGCIVSGFAKALVTLISMMLQYNIPWNVVYSKLQGMKFDPMDIEHTSLVDAIAVSLNKIIISKQEEYEMSERDIQQSDFTKLDQMREEIVEWLSLDANQEEIKKIYAAIAQPEQGEANDNTDV